MTVHDWIICCGDGFETLQKASKLPTPDFAHIFQSGTAGHVYKTQNPDVLFKITSSIDEISFHEVQRTFCLPGIVRVYDLGAGPITVEHPYFVWRSWLDFTGETAFQKLAETYGVTLLDIKGSYMVLRRDYYEARMGHQCGLKGLANCKHKSPWLTDYAVSLLELLGKNIHLTDIHFNNVGTNGTQVVLFDAAISEHSEYLKKNLILKKIGLDIVKNFIP